MNPKNRVIWVTAVILAAIGLGLWLGRGRAPSPPVASDGSGSPAPTPAPPSTTLQPPPDSASGSDSQRKFADIGVLERNAIRREIAKQGLPAIFRAMLDAERVEHDSLKQMSLRTTLAGALRTEAPTPAFLDQLRAFLKDGANSEFERGLVLGALKEAATSETLTLLLEIANTSNEQRIKGAAASLGGVGAYGQGGPELSPALEQAWRDSRDPTLLLSTSSAMAKIGAPSSIELLLATVRAGDAQDKARLDAARRALGQVYLPSAVPPLAAALADQSPASETARLVTPVLVRIGDTTSGRVVVEWLQKQNADASSLIRDLIVQRTTNGEMLNAWADALKPTIVFQNERNREAIREGLAEYESGRVLSPSEPKGQP